MAEKKNAVEQIRLLKFDKKLDVHKVELAATLEGIETGINFQLVRFENVKKELLEKMKYPEEIGDDVLPTQVKNFLELVDDLIGLQFQKEQTYFSFLKKLEREEKSGTPP